MESVRHESGTQTRLFLHIIAGVVLTIALAVGGAFAGLSALPAKAAAADTWPLVVTDISPAPSENGKNSFNYEYFEIFNTTDQPIDLVKTGYSLAYTSNTTSPDSPLADYPLRYQAASVVVAAHSPLVVWIRDSSTNMSLTDSDFRSFWAKVDTNAGFTPATYQMADVTGTNGLSNSGSRGIRITDTSGNNVNYAFYPALAANQSALFRTPTEANSKQMDVYQTGAISQPGVVDNAQLLDRPSTASPSASAQFSLSQPADSSNLDGLIDTTDIDKTFQTMHLMGTVLMAKNGAVVTRSYGDANHATNTANTADTLFATASLQKSMTASLIMQLINEGKLGFDTQLTNYFPVAPFSAASTPITVRMLLEHTSGIHMPEMPVFSTPGDSSSPQLVLSTQESQIQNAINSITISNQGTFSYSNGNYTMLAALASKVTGEPYEQLMEDRVFKPAGMDHTYFWDTVPADQKDNIAQEYQYQNKQDYGTANGPVATESLLSSLLGAGNLYATVGDYYKFSLALQNGKVLTKDEYKIISDNQIAVNGYAGGLYHYPGYTKRARGSNGTDVAGGRYNSYIYAAENNNNFVVIFSNQSYIGGLPAPENSYDNLTEYLYNRLRINPVLSSVQSPMVTTALGVAPALPSKVTVGFTGETTADTPATVGATFPDLLSTSKISPASMHTQTESTAPISVVWSSVDPKEYAEAGTFTVTGQLVGLHQSVVAQVSVPAAASPSAEPTNTDEPSAGNGSTSGDHSPSVSQVAPTSLQHGVSTQATEGSLASTGEASGILLFSVVLIGAGALLALYARKRMRSRQ